MQISLIFILKNQGWWFGLEVNKLINKYIYLIFIKNEWEVSIKLVKWRGLIIYKSDKYRRKFQQWLLICRITFKILPPITEFIIICKLGYKKHYTK